MECKIVKLIEKKVQKAKNAVVFVSVTPYNENNQF